MSKASRNSQAVAAAALAIAALLAGGCEARPTPPGVTSQTDVSAPTDLVLPAEVLRRRLAIAQHHAEADATFAPGLAAAPAGVLLIGAEQETLFCHNGEAEGFTSLGRDPITRCPVAARAPSGLPTAMRATFPAVGGRSTIVIGEPRSTGESLGGWTLTLVHERFHALQQSRPDYAEKTLALELHDGDQTGAWMLDYPFPYDDPRVIDTAEAAAGALAAALNAIGTPRLLAAADGYALARRDWAKASGASAWRYAEFQMWQEGVARHVELLVARDAPPGRDRAVDYVALAGNLEAALFDELANLDPERDRRLIFYPMGAGEALLLDALDQTWRDRYFDGAPALGPRLNAALTLRTEESSPAARSD